MQPRRHRLGDVVDDYCSRCRLLSNHAIAAIVDDVIKQTRCSTCDFEHPYKDGKLPARRTRKDATSALYKQVLDNVTDGGDDTARSGPPPRPVLARPDAPRPQLVTSEPIVADTPAPAPAAAAPPAPAPVAPPAAVVAAPRPVLVTSAPVAAAPAPSPAAAPAAAAAPTEPAPAEDRANTADEGIVHRRLIRATLPRAEGAEREPRPIPTFTVHEAANARGKFRRFPRPAGHGHGGHGNGNFAGNGNANGNAMPRFGHGGGHGQPSPFGAQGRGHGKGGQQPNRGNHGNRANQQRRGNKGR